MSQPTTKVDTAPPTTTTSTPSVGENLEEVARVFSPGGQGCKDGRGLSAVVVVSATSSLRPPSTRGGTKEEDRRSSSTTTTPKRLSINMKVKNNKKKVVRMTDTEKDEMKKTTKDIRGFFGKMKTSQTEEEVKKTTADVPSSFKSLLKLAEGRGKPTTPNNKVSHNNIISKPCVPTSNATFVIKAIFFNTGSK